MLLFNSALTAQSFLRGKILDAKTKEPLVGASLLILNTASGASSDINGDFKIDYKKSLPLIIQCSYIGYEVKNVVIENYAGESIQIFLLPNSFLLGAVDINAEAKGAIRALIQQRVSDHIVNILASEQIEKFPDVNAAEAIQRIPGVTLQRDQGEGRYVQLRGTPPELTTFNVNGEQMPSPEGKVRYVGLDILSVDQIDLIEVTKVFTPDMDADGIGGNINVITKSPNVEIPELKINFSAGYNSLRNKNLGQFQFSFHQKMGKLGFGIVGNYYENNQAAENMEFEFGKGPFYGSQILEKNNYFLQYRESQLRYYEVDRKRIGLSPVLTFKIKNGKEFYLKGLYSHYADQETRRRIIHTMDDAVDFNYYLYGGIERDLKFRTKNQNLSSLNLGGLWDWKWVKSDFQITFSNANEREPDRLEVNFENPGKAIQIAMNQNHPIFPISTYPTPEGQLLSSNFNFYTFQSLLFENAKVDDRNITPRLNVEFPYTSSTLGKGYLKFGGKIRIKEKSRDISSSFYGAYFENVSIYPGSAPKLSIPLVSDAFSKSNFFGYPIKMEAIPGANEIKDFFEFYPQHFIYNRTDTKVASFGEDYQAKERISSVYGMIKHEWKRLTIIAGTRLEHTNIDYQGFQVLTKGSRFLGLDTLNDQRNHLFILPQFQVNYRLPNNTNLKAALTHSYARPNFEDVLPYREQDRTEVKYGNPDLKYPFSRNLDLIGERYFSDGFFSVGLFYKHISNFVFFYKRFAHEGDPADYALVEINKAINGNNAHLGGIELMYQRKFWFLTGFLKDFGIYTNYTLTQSKANIFKRLPANYTEAVVEFGKDDFSGFANLSETEFIPLPGQAPHAGNLSLFYENAKFYVRVSSFFQSAFLFRLGADKELDEYYGQQLRLDFTGNISVGKSMRLFFDAANLTNAPLTFYLGSTKKIPRLIENYGWWARMGIKWNLN
jgi:TonB-dependent receptor